MLGAPASGKGTQGRLLAEALVVPHISTGGLLRTSIDEGDPHAIREIVESGDLVPDEITEQVLFPELGEGFVLDGYPRTLRQAERLDEFLDDVGRPLDAAIELVVPDGTLAARMALRASEERRSDDTPDVFFRRLRVHHEEAERLREHYAGRLVQVEGTGSEDDVFRKLVRAVRP
jgi:adenylate kinase